MDKKSKALSALLFAANMIAVSNAFATPAHIAEKAIRDKQESVSAKYDWQAQMLTAENPDEIKNLNQTSFSTQCNPPAGGLPYNDDTGYDSGF